MSIVPLNLGAAAPFKLKPHFVQVVACSVFCVPQFGQNTRKTSHKPASTSLCNAREAAGSVKEVAPGSKKNERTASVKLQFTRFHPPTTPKKKNAPTEKHSWVEARLDTDRGGSLACAGLLKGSRDTKRRHSVSDSRTPRSQSIRTNAQHRGCAGLSQHGTHP